jgi:ABC-type transporter Mla MlaB component
MAVTQRYTVEAHAHAATLYLTGSVSVAALLEVFRRCENLPSTVWMLRIDVSAAEPLDEGTRTVFAHLLRRSRATRGWVTQVVPVQSGVNQGGVHRRFLELGRRYMKRPAVCAGA